VPTIAGVSNMHYRTFVVYNVIGGLLWGVGITTLGYFLGEIDFIKQNIEVAIVVIVALSVLPMAIEFFRHWRAAKRHADVVDSVDLPPVPADVPATD
jgi:membrane-associated protein